MTMITFRSPRRFAIIGLTSFCVTTVIILLIYSDVFSRTTPKPYYSHHTTFELREKSINTEENEYKYSRQMPVIFIGGMPRSGTTLMRVMMDSHPDVRCGGETRVIPRILNLRNSWLKAPVESLRLHQAGITADVIDAAVGEFMLEVIVRHGKRAKRLCNKDPFTLRSSLYIKKLFPNAQFLFMIRDGRAVAHSIISRKVTISGFNITDYRQCLQKWNAATKAMYEQCTQLGPEVCHPVVYEQLVLHPRRTVKAVLDFLNISWSESVLHHEKFIDQPDGVELSKLERSTDQVVKPINTDQLSAWVGSIPDDVVKDMAQIAPMLKVLGYAPNENPPNYGNPDAFVLAKMRLIQQNKSLWKEKEDSLIRERENLRMESASAATSTTSN